MTATRLKSELWVASYGFPKFFRRSLVEGHVNPPHMYCVQVPSSTVEVLPPFDPMTGLNIRLTHRHLTRRPKGNSTLRHFSTSTLNASLLSTHETFLSPELPKSCKLAIVVLTFGSFGSLYNATPQILCSPKVPTPESRSVHQPLWLGRNIPGVDM
jgi:hypothetical protein